MCALCVIYEKDQLQRKNFCWWNNSKHFLLLQHNTHKKLYILPCWWMSFREDVQSFKVYDDIQHKNIRGNGAKILKRCNAGLYSLPVLFFTMFNVMLLKQHWRNRSKYLTTVLLKYALLVTFKRKLNLF